ncbi:MAG: DUF4832 domain-containing protein [Bradymonadia bacterium]
MRLYLWMIAYALLACEVRQQDTLLLDARVEDAERNSTREFGMNSEPPEIDSDTRVEAADQMLRQDLAIDAGRLMDVRLEDSAYVDAQRSAQSDAEVVDPTILTGITYTATVGDMSNPERGIYVHVEQHLNGTQSTPIQQIVFDRVYATGKRLVLLVIDLGAHRTEDLSAEELQVLNQDFNRIKNSGLKAILRFRYTASASLPYGDVHPERVARHLSQLTDVLHENADVILTIQAGFIGAWGEWYYTDYWGDLGIWSDSDRRARRELVEHLLMILPESRTVQLRTPRYTTELFGADVDCASEGVGRRIGQHNDCFLASASDFGTYVNPDVEQPWLEENSRCAVMGGETCALSDRAHCEVALDELSRFHWTFLNGDYHPDVIARFQSEGCWDEIVERLGYRFVLERVEHSVEVSTGGLFRIEVTGWNQGFATPIHRRDVEVVLQDLERAQQWSAKLAEDPRTWESAFSFIVEIGLPLDMPEGDYHLALRLADPEPRLRGLPRYAIAFANVGVFDDATGLNQLQSRVSVSNGGEATYTGDAWFTPMEQGRP